jgi:hypothetical protein
MIVKEDEKKDLAFRELRASLQALLERKNLPLQERALILAAIEKVETLLGEE